jgi:putative solute:sodium symporter small subunit
MSEVNRSSAGSVDVTDPRIAASVDRYWRANVAVMVVLLVLWAAAGLGCGVLFADALNGYRLGGFPLGFWFAQQGSIAIFVVIILLYAIILDRLDARHHREVERIIAGADSRDAAARESSRR